MANTAPKSTKEKNKGKSESKSRIFPVMFAGIFCLILGVSSGYGAWFLFGKKSNGKENREKLVSWGTNLIGSKKNVVSDPAPTPEVEVVATPILTPIPTPTVELTPTATPTPTETPEAEKKVENQTQPDGVVLIEGGTVEIGGDKRPAQRETVENFYVAETEVTNAQYAEYITATGKQAPPGWKSNKFPKGMDNFPVTGVSFSDANAFCKWLGVKLGAEVRLPSEAEWERAARGDTGNKYPWGNLWDKKAALSKETGGKISRVKTFEINKSPFGVYDMVGNVWEWTESQLQEPSGKAMKIKGVPSRIVKGGSASDTSQNISTNSWTYISEHTKDKLVGFRYVVLKKDN